MSLQHPTLYDTPGDKQVSCKILNLCTDTTPVLDTDIGHRTYNTHSALVRSMRNLFVQWAGPLSPVSSPYHVANSRSEVANLEQMQFCSYTKLLPGLLTFQPLHCNEQPG